MNVYICHKCFYCRRGACVHPDGPDLRQGPVWRYCANWYSALVDALIYLRRVQEALPRRSGNRVMDGGYDTGTNYLFNLDVAWAAPAEG